MMGWATEEDMHHELKILPTHFVAVIEGRKTFEIRKDDRGFQAGDTVTLREYSEHQKYTGRRHSAAIGYVTEYEQRPGYVVFSLVPNVRGNRRPEPAGRRVPASAACRASG